MASAAGSAPAPVADPVQEDRSSPALIESIAFEGNQSISAAQLKQLMRMSREGGAYIPGNLRADLSQIEKTYQDLGFLKVQLEMPDVRVQAAGDRKTVLIRVVVREGPRYLTGTISVKDARALASGALLQLCPLQKGQPYSRMKAAQWQEKVEDAYHSMGYLRVQCPVREAIHEMGRTVDCALECTEGKIYTIGKIEVAGDSAVKPSEFKRRLLFSEGGVFNPEMVSLSIQFLNQARLYEPLSGSDVDIRIDDEKGIVDVSIRLTPHGH